MAGAKEAPKGDKQAKGGAEAQAAAGVKEAQKTSLERLGKPPEGKTWVVFLKTSLVGGMAHYEGEVLAMGGTKLEEVLRKKDAEKVK